MTGSGTLLTGSRGAAFRRTSCCLYYRIGPGANPPTPTNAQRPPPAIRQRPPSPLQRTPQR
ncbi:(2Fe-2S)-binding protein [Kitasatospora sp. NPDC001683]